MRRSSMRKSSILMFLLASACSDADNSNSPSNKDGEVVLDNEAASSSGGVLLDEEEIANSSGAVDLPSSSSSGVELEESSTSEDSDSSSSSGGELPDLSSDSGLEMEPDLGPPDLALIMFNVPDHVSQIAWNFGVDQGQDPFDMGCNSEAPGSCQFLMDPEDGDTLLDSDTNLFGSIYINSVLCFSGQIQLQAGEHGLVFDLPVFDQPYSVLTESGPMDLYCPEDFLIVFE